MSLALKGLTITILATTISS